jgi:hypothetical protein
VKRSLKAEKINYWDPLCPGGLCGGSGVLARGPCPAKEARDPKASSTTAEVSLGDPRTATSLPKLRESCQSPPETPLCGCRRCGGDVTPAVPAPKALPHSSAGKLCRGQHVSEAHHLPPEGPSHSFTYPAGKAAGGPISKMVR